MMDGGLTVDSISLQELTGDCEAWRWKGSVSMGDVPTSLVGSGWMSVIRSCETKVESASWSGTRFSFALRSKGRTAFSAVSLLPNYF